ncbi:MAG: hypothetical protein ACI9CQ_003019 [Saprospiraceae bacterium]|jgi:hypothetical protein
MKQTNRSLLGSFFLIFLFCINNIVAVKAQSIIESSFSVAEITIGFQAGASYNLTTGKAKKGMDNYFLELQDTDLSYTSFNGEIKPLISVLLGLTVNYQWKENMSFNTGLFFQKRGYNLELEAEEISLDYQFDQFYDYSEKFRMSTLEVPLSIGFSLGNRLKVNPGLSLGFGLENSANISSTSKQEVIINGERYDNLSGGTIKETYDYKDLPKGVFIGFFLEASCQVFTNMSIAGAFKRVGPYADLDYGKLSDYSINLSLRYELASF